MQVLTENVLGPEEGLVAHLLAGVDVVTWGCEIGGTGFGGNDVSIPM